MQQTSRQKVTVIGMGLGKEDLTARHLDLISRADILIGGARQLACFPKSGAITKEINKNLAEVVGFIRERMASKAIVVLASGDPLFYGIGAYLAKQLGSDNIEVHPNISSIAGAFARLKLPWHDADILSLHGRKLEGAFYSYFAGKHKVAVLTDSNNTPAWLARRLLDCGLDDFTITILEHMGSENEKVTRCSLQTAAKGATAFSQPNVVVLLRQPQQPGTMLHPGMPDQAFEHQRGLITKTEVRIISIAKLRLRPGQTLWDLGSGCGSVAIEASQYLGRGRIVALEKSPERADMIRRNCLTYDVANLEVVCGEMPLALEKLAPPDRIFIGGGGRDLAAIITRAAVLLKPGGIMVVNTVVLENMQAAMTTMESLAMQPEITQVQVSRGHGLPHGRMLKAQNPVWILTSTQTKRV